MRKFDSEQIDALEGEIGGRVWSLADQTIGAVRGVRREFTCQLKEEPCDLVMTLALRLTKLPTWSLRSVGYQLVQHHKPSFVILDATCLQELGEGLDTCMARATGFRCASQALGAFQRSARGEQQDSLRFKKPRRPGR